MTQCIDRHVKTKNEQGVLVLTIADPEVREYEVANELRQELYDAFTQSGARKVALDFGSVHFIGSVAFWPVISLNAEVRDVGGRLILCNMTPLITQVFDRTRLLIDSRSPGGLFEYAPDLATAITRLNGSDAPH